MKKIFKIFAYTFISSLLLFTCMLIATKFLTKNSDITFNDKTEEYKEESTLTNDNTEANTEEITTAEYSKPQVTTSESDIPPVEEDILLCFTGDVCFTDLVSRKLDSDGLSGIISDNVHKELIDADITMINLEFAFSERGEPMKDKQYTFRANPLKVSHIKDAGVDIVTLANNHTLDFGTTALIDTMDTLDGAGIIYVGAGRNITEARETRYIDIKGKRIAVLAASRVIPVTEWNATDTRAGLFTTYDPTALVEEIKIAEEDSDFIVVYVHWGIERDTKPQEYQRNLAKQYIDAGADIVVGSHPHVLQGIEYYEGKPIIYSLGNFIFNNSIERTAILKAKLDRDNQTEIYLLPCFATNALTDKLKDEGKVKGFYEYMEGISFGVDVGEDGRILSN